MEGKVLFKNIDVINEVQQNFIDSSYDVNTNRAFPSVFDGLKPGQRACLWEMWTKKYTSNKPHVKSAKIDGGVAALWWPHGTTALYETFARMSQPFTNNIPEVDFHGANGNIILGGDAIAADRYTEARLAKITEEGMFAGIDKKNVPMILNFSEDEEWPQYLPAIFPRLLVNGSQGIGVSLAQTWLPHNFTETANLILDYLDTGELKEDTYYPDFPTGGTIINKNELATINKTGKGKVVVDAKYRIDGNEIVFYEMPYQVYIEPVIEKIKEAVERGELTGLADVLNKSDKKNIALVIECQKGFTPEEVVKNLFHTTPLRSQYNANQNAIMSKTPVLLNLKEVVDIYIQHNCECIQKEYQYDLDAANARLEILNGLIAALTNIDDIIAIIRHSDNAEKAKETLKNRYNFSENQAKAILDMRLSKLAKLDGIKLSNEQKEKEKQIKYCKIIVESFSEQKKVLYKRLAELAKKYGDKRRTQVIQKTIVKTSMTKTAKEEVVENVVITFNSLGYLQNIPLAEYRKNDFEAFKITTKDFILLFSNQGRFFRVSPKDVKSCGPKDKGTAIGAILSLDKGEKIIAAFDSIINEKRPYILFAMENGYVKKTEKAEYIGTTRNIKGMVATKLKDCEIVSIQETNGNDIILTSKQGYSIRFHADEVRASGKASLGVIGIKLNENDLVIDAKILEKADKTDIPTTKRAGKGKRK